MRRLATWAASIAAATLAVFALVWPASRIDAQPAEQLTQAHRPRAARSSDPPERRSRRARTRSRSIGFAWQGRLENGVLLRESELVRYAGEYREHGNFYGTWQLVQLLERAAERVHQRLPGARLSVGELSGPRGGPLPGHRSHESGRDVDVSFYMLGPRERPFEPFAVANFGADGAGRGANSMLRFDDDRNWELVAKLVADGDARVQYIFVANAIQRRLLRTARRRHAPRSIVARAEQVMVQPSHGHPHANHFHVRIYCNPHERPRCRDRAPFHAWYPGTPPAEDREAVSAEARRP